jgi:hypothetical protein
MWPGVHAMLAGDAAQQRGLAGAACADDGHAFADGHLERAGAERPHAGRASEYAGGVALPEVVDASA